MKTKKIFVYIIVLLFVYFPLYISAIFMTPKYACDHCTQAGKGYFSTVFLSTCSFFVSPLIYPFIIPFYVWNKVSEVLVRLQQ